MLDQIAMQPQLLMHRMPEFCVYEVIDDGERSESLLRPFDEEDLPTIPDNLEALRNSLQAKVSVRELSFSSYSEHSSSICLQDLGVSLISERGYHVVLLGSMSNTRRASNQFSLMELLDNLGIERARSLSEERFEGGDIVAVGRKLFLRRGGRTNDEGISFIRKRAEPMGYTITEVEMVPHTPVVHLTTACTWAGRNDDGRDFVVVNPAWVSKRPFLENGLGIIEVDAKDRVERWGANVLPVADTLFIQDRCPKLKKGLEDAGFSNIVEIPWDRLRNRPIGLTCVCFVMDHMAQVT